MFQVIRGFSPDLDPHDQGILTLCSQIVPTLRGFKAAASVAAIGSDAVAATVIGAGAIRKLDGTSRTFAGTTVAIYELSGTSWTNRTGAGGPYTANSDGRWRFVQFGNNTYAAVKGEVLQKSTGTTFEDVAGGAPKAACIETVLGFVFLANTNDATYGDTPHRWWCSAINNPDSWTASIATQATTGVITSIPGAITGLRRLGDRIILYKERGITVGTYTGPPFVWSMRDIPTDIGAVSQEVIVNLKTAHYFMSPDGFYMFDGVQVTPIDDAIRNWWRTRINGANLFRSVALHERSDTTITWFYPTSGSTLDSGVSYNYRSGTWGVRDRTVQTAVEYAGSGITYSGLGAVYSTYNDLPAVSYNSGVFGSDREVPAVFDSANKLYKLDGPPGAWSFTTHYFGGDQQSYMLNRVIPRWISAANAANMQNFYRQGTVNGWSSDTTVAMDSGRFNARRDARWHYLVISGTGSMEISGFELDVKPSGSI